MSKVIPENILDIILGDLRHMNVQGSEISAGEYVQAMDEAPEIVRHESKTKLISQLIGNEVLEVLSQMTDVDYFLFADVMNAIHRAQFMGMTFYYYSSTKHNPLLVEALMQLGYTVKFPIDTAVGGDPVVYRIILKEIPKVSNISDDKLV